jgi:hypothetical protein
MIRRLLPALAPLLVVSCSYSIVRHGEIDTRQAVRIERGVARIRELPLKEEVPMEVKGAGELRAFLREELDREYSKEDLAGMGRAYERMGLLPPSIDLGEKLLELYGSQVAGFYDPRAVKLFLVPSGVPSPGWPVTILQALLRRDLVNEMLLAHELTHALQDQNFGVLGSADDPSNDDRGLALKAVIEGDATLAGFAYVFGGLPAGSVEGLVAQLGAIPTEMAATLPNVPPILRESLVFQYSAGAAFVAEAYLRAGWRGVDALLRYPPTSTEQVLWPESYFGTVDTPTTVSLGGLEDYQMSGEWKLLEENTLGELAIRVLAGGFVDSQRALEIARGWDGDRFAAFERGKELHLYWMSVWDSDADAVDFFAAERDILGRKFPASGVSAAERRIVATGPDPYLVERRGAKVLVAIGVPAKSLKKRVEDVWAKTGFTPERLERDLDLARPRE